MVVPGGHERPHLGRGEPLGAVSSALVLRPLVEELLDVGEVGTELLRRAAGPPPRASRRASRPDATTKTTLNTMNPAESSEPVATHRATAMSSGTVADNTGKPGSRTAGGGVGRSTVIGSWVDGTAG